MPIWNIWREMTVDVELDLLFTLQGGHILLEPVAKGRWATASCPPKTINPTPKPQNKPQQQNIKKCVIITNISPALHSSVDCKCGSALT